MQTPALSIEPRYWHGLAAGLALVAALAPVPVQAQAQAAGPETCGPIYNTGHYGPHDYRHDKNQLVVVEKYHFAPQVEALIRGQSTSVAGDLNYVLKASPNHHRALVAVMRLGERAKSPRLQDLDYSIECFLERGVRFKPDDNVVRALFAQYLGKQGRKAEAVGQLDDAIQFAGDNPLSQFNIGLVFFELGSYDRALQQAHKVRKLGYERPELEEMLKKANQWQEPAP